MKYIYGRNPVIEMLKAEKVDKLYIQQGNIEGSIKKIFAMAKSAGVLITEVNKNKLDEYANSSNHQGVVALVSDFEYSSIEEIQNLGIEKILILDKIEDPHNFGAIARSAEAFGFNGIVIPKHNSAYVNDVVYKTSAGAIERLKVAIVVNLTQTIEKLKENGYWIYGTDLQGENYSSVNLKGKIALIIGNEGKGMSQGLKKHVDGMLTIPMIGSINSLNASCAASVLMAEVLRQDEAAKL